MNEAIFASPLPSPIFRVRATREHKRGFSLIEVLVATTLLVIIVVMVGMVFRQSAMSWDSGIARADGSMLVRAVIGALERDFRAAVDSRKFPGVNLGQAMIVDETLVKFVALLDETEGHREPTLVEIKGGTEVTRSVAQLTCREDGTWTPGVPTITTLLYSGTGNAKKAVTTASVVFEPGPTDPDDAKGMPLWVNANAELVHTEDFSGVRARSVGRDGKPNTSDDVETR